MTGLLGVLRQTDARFLAGTDAANPMMIAGFSIHEELATLVRDAGFSNFEAIAMATRNVGEFLGDTLRGRIAVGAPADLILVADDPLKNLSTLRSPLGVMTRGRWFARAQLDSMLRSLSGR
jgi:imidazolonepropionase-like amidohydrolase